MYIGTSLGKCLISILRDEVRREDVCVIITRTLALTLEQFMSVVDEYYNYGATQNKDYDFAGFQWPEVEQLATYLWSTGKIHQPRIQNGNTGYLMPEMKHCLWMEVVAIHAGSNPSVVQAFEHYKILKSLAN